MRPLGKKTQPTATPSTGQKGHSWQKCQKYSAGKCPSGARRNRKDRWLKSRLYRFKCLVACRSLKPRGTARNGRVWREFDAAGRTATSRDYRLGRSRTISGHIGEVPGSDPKVASSKTRSAGLGFCPRALTFDPRHHANGLGPRANTSWHELGAPTLGRSVKSWDSSNRCMHATSCHALL